MSRIAYPLSSPSFPLASEPLACPPLLALPTRFDRPAFLGTSANDTILPRHRSSFHREQAYLKLRIFLQQLLAKFLIGQRRFLQTFLQFAHARVPSRLRHWPERGSDSFVYRTLGISSQFYQLSWQRSAIGVLLFRLGEYGREGKKRSTFGTKTKHRVAVLQNIMNIANIMNMASCLSAKTKLIAAPVTHMITTLYTLIPTYLLSFNAGMLTCLVSHAKKAPNIWKSGSRGERSFGSLHFLVSSLGKVS